MTDDNRMGDDAAFHVSVNEPKEPEELPIKTNSAAIQNTYVWFFSWAETFSA
ncbi:hypothetical protein CSUI_007347 [Cystoisospora suis]|uniref:Uncharacterized protein n=1 Tax=Cystoisospora suis TaxID=483139 RepID=A0A2C6KQR3_9APIC|nr:hypothetical protein CSUI_007347 [Cystoisospora suis]